MNTQRSAHPFAPRAETKSAELLDRLQSPKGATLTALSKDFGWQPHTVRASITGLRKRGYAIRRSTDDKGRSLYAIEKA